MPFDRRDPVFIEEYKVLRSELEANRRLVFERPLFILLGTVGSVGLAARVGGNNGQPDVLFAIAAALPVVVGAFWYNLAFTANRVQSSARIIGYIIEVYDKRTPNPYGGWENALIAYRLFRHLPAKKGTEVPKDRRGVFKSIVRWPRRFFSFLRNLRAAKDANEGLRDTVRFYRQIVNLHCGIVGVALLSQGFILARGQGDARWIAGAGLGIAVAFFVHVALGLWRSFLSPQIATERALWQRVLDESRDLIGQFEGELGRRESSFFSPRGLRIAHSARPERVST